VKSTIPRRRLASLQSLLIVLAALAVPTVASVVAAPPAHAASAGDVVFERDYDYNNTLGDYEHHAIAVRHANGTVETIYDVGIHSLGGTPSVSPDGSKIAFVSDLNAGNGGDSQDMFVINADGSGLTQLDVNNPDRQEPQFIDRAPSWSPDSQSLVFGRAGLNVPNPSFEQLWVIHLGGSTTQLSGDDRSYYSPAWSPDGTKIAYYAGSGLETMAANGDEETETVVPDQPDYGANLEPTWAPGGTSNRLYFSNGIRIFGIDIDGTDLVTVAEIGGNSPNHPSVSADGTEVVYAVGFSLYVSPADGTDTDGGLLSNTSDSGVVSWYPSFVQTSWSIKTLAVLGDSFSSGEGNPDFIFGTNTSTDKCHRSNQAYSHVLDSTPSGLSLELFVACSGATSAQVEDGHWTEDSQTDALDELEETPDVIALTVGGNDVQFNEFATDCVAGLTGCLGSDQYDATMGLIENTLPDALDDLFDNLSGKVGNNTRVLVLGYPKILPYTADAFTCGYITTGEPYAVEQVQTGLNDALEAAVGRADSHFEFVDANATGSPFAGHRLCTSSSYFNGLDLVHQEYSFHPNEEGHVAFAKLVTDYLHANPS
jgi:Tol biopolymer transport system component